MSDSMIDNAVKAVRNGDIIIYPTESVYGLGCDPYNYSAVKKLLEIKQRSVDKGLILIAGNIQQILPMIRPKSASDLANALKTWPGHNTWVFPKSKLVPHWVSGNHQTIAVRVSKHPTVIELCNKLNSSLISTSANLSNQEVLTSIKALKHIFGDKIAAYIDAPLGQESLPSQIRDAHTLQIYR
jgi:L-threonylcarbamoyladenylate synthase